MKPMIRIPADRGFHSSIRLAPQAPRGSRPEARFHEGGAPGWQVSEEPAWATGCKLLKRWSGRPGSNRRPTAWKAETLPLSYSRLAFVFNVLRCVLLCSLYANGAEWSLFAQNLHKDWKPLPKCTKSLLAACYALWVSRS